MMWKKALRNWKRVISGRCGLPEPGRFFAFSAIRACACLGFSLVFFSLLGCAYSRPLALTYVFEGPPLALYGESGERVFEGEMERTSMIGSGRISLRDTVTGLVCSGELDTRPSLKGIVRGYMTCADAGYLVFGLRNLGSDQGFGVGYFVPASENGGGREYVGEGRPKEQRGERITLFYHPWMDEAKRRLGPIRADLDGLDRTLRGNESKATTPEDR